MTAIALIFSLVLGWVLGWLYGRWQGWERGYARGTEEGASWWKRKSNEGRASAHASRDDLIREDRYWRS
jgi:hypothetical protein